MAHSSSSVGPRIQLLDLWRGMALVDMAWVHLATYPIGMPDIAAVWIGEHTRFAAGALVLLSGLTVRRAFGLHLETGGNSARRSVVRLMRRALLLVLVGLLANVAYAAIEQLVMDPSWIPSLRLHGLVLVATFRSPGVTGGLLLLYAVLLLLTPLLERLRALAGPVPVMLLSLAVFAAAQVIGPAAHWPPWAFPLAHWQPLFVAGYLASPLLERWEAAPVRAQTGWLLVTTVACAAVFVVRNPVAVGVASAGLPVFDFTKVPLGPAELVWYFVASAFVLTWSAVLHERSKAVRRASGWLRTLGRWSLLVYVSHLLLELPIIAFLTLSDPSPAMRATMLPLIAAAMAAVAAIAERLSAGGFVDFVRAPRVALRFVPPAGALGSAVAVCCATLVLVMQATISQAPPRLRAEEATGEVMHDELLNEVEYGELLSVFSAQEDDDQLLDFGDDAPPGLSELPFADRQEQPAPGELPADGA